MSNSEKVLDKLFYQAQSTDFAGYDPFDGLNSPIFRLFAGLKNSLPGLAWTQLFKRSPVNLRSLVGITPQRNPKGVALFILGMLQRPNFTDHQGTAVQLAEWLMQQRCDPGQWPQPCWGYHFDWKARAFYVPKGTPNVISTYYVSKALYDLGARLNRGDMQQLALDSAGFMTRQLFNTGQKGAFFAYIPGKTAFVHNANLWACAWVAFSAQQSGNTEQLDLALQAADSSVQAQRSDGSWLYGERDHHHFIDGFHTGYNLEALHDLQQATGEGRFLSNIELGLDYYKRTFFTPEGATRYYHNCLYPLDMHSVAQALITLCKVGGSHSDIAQARKTLNWSLEQLYDDSRGAFLYQRQAWGNNAINYIRWTQAWAFYGLAFFQNYQDNQT